VADAGVTSDQQPPLETGDREPRAIAGEMEGLPHASTGEIGSEALEVGGAQTGDEGGDRGRCGESVEAELPTEVGTGREGGMCLVVGPSFEGSEEEETDHIAGIGGRATGSVGRADRVGRG
jgi:hypothetical protein